MLLWQGKSGKQAVSHLVLFNIVINILESGNKLPNFGVAPT